MSNRHIYLARTPNSDFDEANLPLTKNGRLAAIDKRSGSAPSIRPGKANAEETMNKLELS